MRTQRDWLEKQNGESICAICEVPMDEHYTIHAAKRHQVLGRDGHSWYRVCPTTMVLLKQLMLNGHHFRAEAEA